MAFWTWFAGVKCELLFLLEALSSGNLVSLSERQFVDCDTTDSGCKGGLMDNAFSFAKKASICTESSYTYKITGCTCQKSSYSVIDGSFEPTTSVYCHRGRPVFVPHVQVRCAHKVVRIKSSSCCSYQQLRHRQWHGLLGKRPKVTRESYKSSNVWKDLRKLSLKLKSGCM